MIFLELVLENFGPYRGRQVLNLRPNEGKPILLLGGMNGGGKTTLMDAIRLVLYGHRAECSTRGNLSYSNFLKQCINRHTPDSEKTRLELLVQIISGDSSKIAKTDTLNPDDPESQFHTQLRIIRYWTKQDSKDTLGILNGEFPENTLRDTWDDYIENLLPLGISNLFLFDGEQVKELADLDAPPPLVVQAIQSLLGLELADRLDTDLDILSRRQQKQIADKQELGNLEEIDRKLKGYDGEKERITQEIKNTEHMLKRAINKAKEAENEFVSEGGKIAAERHQLDLQRKSEEAKIQQTRDALVNLAATSLPLSLIEPLMEQAIAQGKAEQESLKAQISRDRIQERDRRLLDYLQTLQLAQSQTTDIQSFLQQDYHHLEQEILPPENTWLHATPEELETLEKLIAYDISSQREKAQAESKYLEKLERQLMDVERKLTVAASPERYQELREAKERANDKKTKLEIDLEYKHRQLRDLERSIEEVKKQLKDYSEKFLAQENATHIINSIARVKTILEKYREKLTLKKLNKLENQVTECFRYLLHKSDLVHRVVVSTEDYSLSLYDCEGKPLPKHRLSAGEKQLLAIAFLWGLARVSGRQLPVAIDTPLGRLDSSHRQNLIERYFPSASHQVILLSTDTEIAQTEIENLRNQEAITREYLLKYDPTNGQTTIKDGYFW
ncbi:DNA sulfur modification protein DndD [Roseofilum sp. BLCC_M91]|uniref:Nuclease SbcCD subunit C n=1 Tax=Roseofilum halophilum BLCC-M91 TaxID=3022259 RepID=A0ABT7BMN0_9CYAN|nr:DNA sulfur modification protein DndD [Roseofilum halophilum]MDJ1179543.1 DNA sulfur modification protein DndD [Roseofilum halophilum BLCC-M91]